MEYQCSRYKQRPTLPNSHRWSASVSDEMLEKQTCLCPFSLEACFTSMRNAALPCVQKIEPCIVSLTKAPETRSRWLCRDSGRLLSVDLTRVYLLRAFQLQVRWSHISWRLFSFLSHAQ